MPLLVGLAMLVIALRALIRGEVPCSTKDSGCVAETFLRAQQPHGYWVNTAFFAIASLVLLWMAWRSFRRWRDAAR